jgi:hypothetical protein
MYIRHLDTGEWVLLEDDDTVVFRHHSIAEVTRKKSDLALISVIARTLSGSTSPLVDTPRR